MARKTEKQRKTINVRFGPDPKVAAEQRREFEEAFRKSGSPSYNHFILDAVMAKVRRLNGRTA